jgi:hypothetical protein
MVCQAVFQTAFHHSTAKQGACLISHLSFVICHDDELQARLVMPTEPKHRETRIRLRGTDLSAKGVFRFSVPYFLFVLILNILISPFLDQFWGGFFVEAVLMSLVFLSALLAIGGRRRTLMGALLVAPALVGEWLSYWRPDLPLSVVLHGSGLLFIGFIVLEFLRFIIRAPRVDFGVLCAGIATYLMLGMLWSFAYILVDGLVPNSFVFTVGPDSNHSMNHFNALYFSFTTLSTVGYGDIVPVSRIARILAMAEAVFGMFYVTLLIARLVALYSTNKNG